MTICSRASGPLDLNIELFQASRESLNIFLVGWTHGHFHTNVSFGQDIGGACTLLWHKSYNIHFQLFVGYDFNSRNLCAPSEVSPRIVFVLSYPNVIYKRNACSIVYSLSLFSAREKRFLMRHAWHKVRSKVLRVVICFSARLSVSYVWPFRKLFPLCLVNILGGISRLCGEPRWYLPLYRSLSAIRFKH